MKWGGILFTAAVGLTAYGLYKLAQEEENESEANGMPDIEIPFEAFQKDTMVADQVTGHCIAEWVRGKKPNENTICVVAYPTKEILKEFSITGCPEELDPESNLLQFIIDPKESQVAAARLISFGSVSDKVRELFCGKQYFILKNDPADRTE